MPRKLTRQQKREALVHHGAQRRGGGLLLPGFVMIGNKEVFHPIEDVKRKPKLRDAFVRKLRSELGELNKIRKEKMRLIAYLQDSKP